MTAEAGLAIIAAILGSAGLLAIIYLLAVLAGFGQKLGAVTKMRPFYYGYYVAIACIVVVLVARLIRTSVFWAQPLDVLPLLNSPWFYFLLYHLP
jgi:chromate transport protein ChrA